MTLFSRRTSRTLATIAAALLGAAALAVAAPSSQAVDKKPLIIVGTSDVFDSNLVQAVIKPGFEAAHPEYDLQYVSKGTGAAIAYAEAGSASGLIVHAAALENQFVDQGYSNEKYGRAIFWGDYVLLGPADDPAGVMSGSDPSHDIVTAFEKIAAAGQAGEATFVSRGGTPGTTVQEHAIWALSSGVQTCTVTKADGEGASPSTSSGACASPVGNLPSWYKATGLNQGLNVKAADACSGSSFPNGGCYVFTDRGTASYLDSTGATTKLQIVTRDNAAGARGGSTVLVNSFHAYAVNPDAVDNDAAIDVTGATAFLNWITSPDAQEAISHHLDQDGDPAFLPSAAPSITLTGQSTSVVAGKAATVTGHIENVVPGTPPLNNVQVALIGASGPVTLDRTDSHGDFTLSYRPIDSRTYHVAVPTITKVEVPTLDPVFGDLLTATDTATAPITLKGGYVGVSSVVSSNKSGRAGVQLTGMVMPKATKGAELKFFAAKPGHPLKLVHTSPLATGTTGFTKRYELAAGTWNVQLAYVHDGVFQAVRTPVKQVKLR